MENAAAVGRQVKAQYPQYKNYSDEEIGNRYLQKHGNQSQPPPTPQVTQSSPDLLSGLTDLFIPATKKALSAPFDPNSAMNKNAMKRPNAKGDLGQSIQNAAGATTDLFTTALPGGVELGAWTLPLGKALLARLGLGTLQGGAGEAVREGATPTSIGTNALTTGGLNAALPGLSRLLTSGLGRTAFGKEGDKLPEIIRESGKSMIGTGSQIAEKMYGKTEPIRNNLDKLFLKGGSLSKNDIFDNSITDMLSSGENVGYGNEETALQYLVDAASNLDKEAINKGVNNLNVPLDVVESFLKGTRKALPKKIYGSADLTPSQQVQKDIGGKFTGILREKIKEATVNPKEYDRLKKLLQAATQITNNKGTASNLLTSISPAGIPIGQLLGSSGSQFGVSTLISLLESLPADVIENLLSRGVGAGVASTQRNPQ